PQEAVNLAVETAGDAIDTIVNGVQTLAMTNKPAPRPKAQPVVAVTPSPQPFATESRATAARDTTVTASVAAVPVVAPQASARTEVRVKPQDVPVLDTEAKVEDLMPPFSVTDPAVVSRVQRGLASLGFLHGPIDGVAGEATAKAIRTFETFYNYDRTGRITPELPDLLVKAGATL
ncbi:MAG: peptidoglycan-binding protein, partial [Hyphomicrobiales bacterium]